MSFSLVSVLLPAETDGWAGLEKKIYAGEHDRWIQGLDRVLNRHASPLFPIGPVPDGVYPKLTSAISIFSRAAPPSPSP